MKSLREKLSNAENVLRLNSPKAVVQNYMLKLDEMESRLSAAFSMGLSEKRYGLSPLSERLANQEEPRSSDIPDLFAEDEFGEMFIAEGKAYSGN